MLCLGNLPHSAQNQSLWRPPAKCRLRDQVHLLLKKNLCSGIISAGGGNGGGPPGGSGGSGGGNEGDDPPPPPPKWLRILFGCTMAGACCTGFYLIHATAAGAQALDAAGVLQLSSENVVWQEKQGKWIRHVEDRSKDEFVVDVVKASEEEAMAYEKHLGEKRLEEPQSFAEKGGRGFVNLCLDTLKTTMLPIGYPKSVSEDYTEYTLWRMGQIVANQICCVLTTQALLYAVGLGKGAIPTAAAINWVLKDGVGYLSKIVLSKYGRHFDVHPKRWRLLSDLMEDAANGIELLTPAFPHLFVPITAISGAGKSAAGLIQGATRSCFYAGFAIQQNFAEVIAKGEAQGMVSKSLGIALGIWLSSKVGSSGPLLVFSFAAVTAAHLICNVKSYQAVQLHTLNPYRAALIISEYLNRGEVLSVKDVNAVEPFFLGDLLFRKKSQNSIISQEAKQRAADLDKEIELGVSFGDAVAPSKEAAENMLNLYRQERYILTFRNYGCYKVVLKESATPHDMLRAVVQASYHRHIEETMRPLPSLDELLKLSYENMSQSFEEITQRLKAAGWSAGGLVARPGPFRILSYPPSKSS